MKILFVSFCFPPYNNMGAVRVGKMAKYLASFGHQIKVITAQAQPFPENLTVEVAHQHIVYAPWRKIAPSHALRKKVLYPGNTAGISGRRIGGFREGLGRMYRTLFCFPDEYAGWRLPAIEAGRGILDSWKADLIFASANPCTAFFAASSLSKSYDIPWIAECRDLWVDNQYYSYPRIRRIVDAAAERKILSSAAALVTVSEPLAQALRTKFDKPVEVVFNGFDPCDYPPDSQSCRTEEDALVISYTGTLYEGKHNPELLFEAIRMLGPEGKNIRVVFYGSYSARFHQLSAKYGIEAQVEIHDPVSHDQALLKQARSDILLLLLWNDSRQRGILTGKFFEYIGARRPILAIGALQGDVVELISARKLGVCSCDSAEIAGYLRKFLAQKKENGCIPAPPAHSGDGFTRREQAVRLDLFISRISKQAAEFRRGGA